MSVYLIDEGVLVCVSTSIYTHSDVCVCVSDYILVNKESFMGNIGLYFCVRDL